MPFPLPLPRDRVLAVGYGWFDLLRLVTRSHGCCVYGCCWLVLPRVPFYRYVVATCRLVPRLTIHVHRLYAPVGYCGYPLRLFWLIPTVGFIPTRHHTVTQFAPRTVYVWLLRLIGLLVRPVRLILFNWLFIYRLFTFTHAFGSYTLRFYSQDVYVTLLRYTTRIYILDWPADLVVRLITFYVTTVAVRSRSPVTRYVGLPHWRLDRLHGRLDVLRTFALPYVWLLQLRCYRCIPNDVRL